jgi:DNA-binding NarL/FixJ family response regulator
MDVEQNRAIHSCAVPYSGALVCEEHGLPEAAAITVMIASERKALQAAWFAMLAREAGIEIKGGSDVDVTRLAACVELHLPKILLLDKALLDRLDLQSLRRIHEQCHRVRVLLLWDELCHGPVDAVLRHRFNGFLLTTCPPGVLMKAIRAVSKGELWLSREALAIAITALLSLPEPQDVGVLVDAIRGDASETLTQRELQVVALVRRGCTNQEIADALGIMEGTVKKHLQNVFAKLGVRRRTLVALCRQPASGATHSNH